jgi:hypothetical protein
MGKNGVGQENVLAIISDNAANMNKGRRLVLQRPENSHIFGMRCYMHALSNIVTAILKLAPAKKLVTKAQEIVTYFKSSHKANAGILSAEYAQLKANKRELVTSNQTRLTSVQLCIASVLNNWKAIKRFQFILVELLQTRKSGPQ